MRSKRKSGERGSSEVAAKRTKKGQDREVEAAERESNSRRKLVLGDGFVVGYKIIVPGCVDVGVVVLRFGVSDPRERTDDPRWDERLELDEACSFPGLDLERGVLELKRRVKRGGRLVNRKSEKRDPSSATQDFELNERDASLLLQKESLRLERGHQEGLERRE